MLRLVNALLFLCIAAVFLTMTAGCDTNNDTLTGVEVPRIETPTYLPDGRLNLRRYQVLYLSCGTVTLDYPSDFVGAIPQGHGRIGQTDPSYYCSGGIQALYQGDPTADD